MSSLKCGTIYYSAKYLSIIEVLGHCVHFLKVWIKKGDSSQILHYGREHLFREKKKSQLRGLHGSVVPSNRITFWNLLQGQNLNKTCTIVAKQGLRH